MLCRQRRVGNISPYLVVKLCRQRRVGKIPSCQFSVPEISPFRFGSFLSHTEK